MRRRSDVTLDGSAVRGLADLLTPYVEREGLNLSTSYTWEIPDGAPVASFTTSGLSLADANVRLKRSLSEAWHLVGSDREALVRWYVGRWGGIYANRDATIQRYVLATDEELERAQLNGIASWSKILAMRDPARYAIFDARVSAALNALQIVEGISPVLFPILPSRNSTVDRFHGWLKVNHRSTARIRKDQVYLGYMALLHEVARRLGQDGPDRAEMVLFANGPALAAQAMRPVA